MLDTHLTQKMDTTLSDWDETLCGIPLLHVTLQTQNGGSRVDLARFPG